MSSVEDKAIKKVKAKKAKTKKAAAAVKTGEKGKQARWGQVVKKSIIMRDLDMDLGENEGEIDFPPNVDSDLARSDQIRMIRSKSELEEAKVVVW